MVSFSKKIKRKDIASSFTKKRLSTSAAFRRTSYNPTSESSLYEGSVLVASPLRSDPMPAAYYHALLTQDLSYKRMQQQGEKSQSYADIILSDTQASSIYHALACSSSFSLHRDRKNIADALFAGDIIDRLHTQGALEYSLDVRLWNIDQQTVVSDAQLVHTKQELPTYFIKFFIDSKKYTITARLDDPIFLFGASALAVSPYDKRYKKFVGKEVIVPIINKTIPVITDEYVDMTQDTGAIVLCPTHNRDHFALANKHDISRTLFSLDKNGLFTDRAEEFAGKPAYEFRKNIITYLRDISNLAFVEPREQDVRKHKFHPEHQLIPLATYQRFFSHVNQHLTDSLSVRYDGKDSEEHQSLFFEGSSLCVSQQTQHGIRFPVLIENNKVLTVFSAQSIRSYLQEHTSLEQGVWTTIVLCLMITGALDDTRSLDELCASIIKKEEHLDTYRFHILQQIFHSEQRLLENRKQHIQDLIADPTAIDPIADAVDASFALVCDAEGIYHMDWSAWGYSDQARLSHHVLNDTFASALRVMQGIQERQVQSHEQTLVYGVEQDFAWMQYILSSGLIRAHTTKVTVWSQSVQNQLSLQRIQTLIDMHGGDIVRLLLLHHCVHEYEVQRGQGDIYLRLLNKLWNAVRYLCSYVWEDDLHVGISLQELVDDIFGQEDSLTPLDVRIVLGCDAMIEEVQYYVEKDDRKKACEVLFQYIRYDLCDTYMELNKAHRSLMFPKVLLYVMGVVLQLIYPWAPQMSYTLWTYVGYPTCIDQYVPTKKVFSISKDYTFSMFMDVCSAWVELHAQYRARYPKHQLQLAIKANKNFIEYVKQYEKYVFSMFDVESITYVNEHDEREYQRFDHRIVNVLAGVRYTPVKDTKHDKINALRENYRSTQQLLQNVRSLLLSMDRSSADYVRYTEQMEELKEKLQDIDYHMSKYKYGLS